MRHHHASSTARACRALAAVVIAALCTASQAHPAFSPQLSTALGSLSSAADGAAALAATRSAHAALQAQASGLYGWIESTVSANASRLAERVRSLPSTTDPHPVISSGSAALYSELDAWLTDSYDFLNAAFSAIWTRLDQVYSSGVSVPPAAWSETDALDSQQYMAVDGINDRSYANLDVAVAALVEEVDSVDAAEWRSFSARVNATTETVTSSLAQLRQQVQNTTAALVAACTAEAEAVEADTTTALSALYDRLSVAYTDTDAAASAVYDHLNDRFQYLYPEWDRQWSALYQDADANHLQQPYYELIDAHNHASFRNTDLVNDELYPLADARVESCYTRLDQTSSLLDSRWMEPAQTPAAATAAPVSASTPVIMQATLQLTPVASSPGVPTAVVTCTQVHERASVHVVFDSTGDSCTAPCGTPLVCARPPALLGASQADITVTVTSTGSSQRVVPRDGTHSTTGLRDRTPNVVRLSAFPAPSATAPSSLVKEANGGDSTLNSASHLAPSSLVVTVAAFLVAAVAGLL